MKEKIVTIDIEPKWINLIPLYADWLEHGTTEQKELARKEIKKMAVVCDYVRQAQKRGQKNINIDKWDDGSNVL